MLKVISLSVRTLGSKHYPRLRKSNPQNAHTRIVIGILAGILLLPCSSNAFMITDNQITRGIRASAAIYGEDSDSTSMRDYSLGVFDETVSASASSGGFISTDFASAHASQTSNIDLGSELHAAVSGSVSTNISTGSIGASSSASSEFLFGFSIDDEATYQIDLGLFDMGTFEFIRQDADADSTIARAYFDTISFGDSFSYEALVKEGDWLGTLFPGDYLLSYDVALSSAGGLNPGESADYDLSFYMAERITDSGEVMLPEDDTIAMPAPPTALLLGVGLLGLVLVRYGRSEGINVTIKTQNT